MTGMTYALSPTKRQLISGITLGKQYGSRMGVTYGLFSNKHAVD